MWMKQNGITLVRADKSKAMVLMKRNTYDQLLSEHIKNTRCDIVQRDTVDKLQNRVKRFATTKLAKRLEMRNIIVDAPDTPKLFAFTKIHKVGQQLRPVVDKARAPTHKMEKFVHKLIMPYLEDYPYMLKDPVDLIDTLKKITVTPKFLTVLDFKSLFPSILLPPAFCAIRDLLLSILNNNTLHQQIFEMAHLLCYNSFFQFKGSVYTQGRGIPMGSPISGDLCEMVVRILEAKVLPHHLHNIILHKRYVDDIIILWKEIPDIKAFVDTMNNNTYGLTIEIEQAHQTNVHFLDIDIKVEELVIHMAVYRKLGTKGIYIPVGSCDPPQYKVAPFKALIKRAHTHTSTERALQAELRLTQRIAAEHGYGKLIRKLLHEYQNTNQDLPQREERQDMDKIVPVNYNPYIRRLYGEIARKNHIRIAYRRCALIFNILTNGKDQPDKDRLSGVYSIPIIDRRSEEMDQADKELKESLKKLWPLQGEKVINKLVPTNEGNFFH
ncbi:uncharacterized protein LOC111634973 [Centruroides sculpturatus]|uniref:uncharacterized protein LOC111634973 n=1 Tax=Centruroides sculpturatus TaxID=218467 RepID=UPI000C6CCEE4|nr:uncharacterized protein LOC111634973 [Centruroides sculpturatus]